MTDFITMKIKQKRDKIIQDLCDDFAENVKITAKQIEKERAKEALINILTDSLVMGKSKKKGRNL